MGGSQDSDDQRPSTGKRTRRIVWRVVAFLLLGAVINVAVAWGYTSLTKARTSMLDGVLYWTCKEAEVYKVKRDSGIPEAVLLPHDSALSCRVPGATICIITGSSGMNAPWRLVDLRAGWPLRAISGVGYWSAAGVQSRGYWRIPAYGLSFPLRPIWPGLIVNTIFYAAMVALLVYFAGTLRRSLRIRRSQCPACGHIIASGTCANGLCSECGSPLPKGFKSKPEARAHT